MLNRLKELRNGGEEEGFTLIELMIVVVIIGILAAIAIPIFANQQKAAIDAGTLSDVKNANLTINTWKAKNQGKNNFQAAGVVDELKAMQKLTEGTQLTIFGTPSDYCIKGYNPNGKEYSATSGPYAIFVSETGKLGNSFDLGGASQKSCGTSGTYINL